MRSLQDRTSVLETKFCEPQNEVVQKKRVTAIRSYMRPGLYDNGIFVDDLDKQSRYDVQELLVADDKECYVNNFFFINLEEKQYVIQKARFVIDINNEIDKWIL